MSRRKTEIKENDGFATDEGEQSPSLVEHKKEKTPKETRTQKWVRLTPQQRHIITCGVIKLDDIK